MTTPVIRNYVYSLPAQSSACFNLVLTQDLCAADIADLREWIELICKQLGRLEVLAQSKNEGITEYESWANDMRLQPKATP